ncbi:MAG: DUF2490 domain-containing protein [Bacteroidota bacterium]
MIRSIFFVVALATLFSCQNTFAQPANREIVNQSIEWFGLTTNTKLTKRISLMVEGQFRYAREFEQQQYQARTALEISVNKNLSIAPLAYVYTWNYLYGKQPAAFANNEHRTWQQVTYKHKFARINLQHRLRVEQRFIQTHSINAEGNVINEGYTLHQNRLRYRFLATIPLNKPTMESGSWFSSFYDEAFLSWGENVTFHEPDQNRIFAGLGYQFNSSLSIQSGLLYQMLIKANGAKQENNLGLQVQLTYNLDLTKPGK